MSTNIHDPYQFKWKDLGDITLGRPNLGSTTHVLAYRLMQYTMKEVLNSTFGFEKSNELFFLAGKRSGIEFCNNLLNKSLPIDEFISQLHNTLLRLGIGILKIEKSDNQKLEFTLTISEDLDCSGLPLTGNTVCNYEEGFLAGIMKAYTGNEYDVKEIDCWATGERTCRFVVKSIV